jgi:hypothetical protein
MLQDKVSAVRALNKTHKQMNVSDLRNMPTHLQQRIGKDCLPDYVTPVLVMSHKGQFHFMPTNVHLKHQ